MKYLTMISCRVLGQRGMSLVELLVAMVISLVLLGGVYQIFISSTTISRENEQFSRLQENARFSMEILGRDLRMAGYTGCANIPPGDIVNTLNDTSFLFDFSVGVQGFNYVDTRDGNVVAADFSPALHASIPVTDPGAGADENLVELSDVITIRRLGGQDPIYLEGLMGNSSADMKITDGTSTDLIDDGDIVMLSDCIGAAIFQVTNYTVANGNVVHNQGVGPAYGDPHYPGNATKDLGHPFVAGAEILKLTSTSYAVRTNPAGVPSLYRIDYDDIIADANTVGDELVQGVESMQVRYGVDTSGDRQVDSYVAVAADWTDVIAVRVTLLLQSDIDDKIPVDTSTYDLDGDATTGVNGREYDPADERRMRRVVKGTFALRNQVP